MKLVKILPDKIQIKTDDVEFKNSRLNDLVSVSDGEVEIVTMITAITDNDVSVPLAEDDFLTELLGSVKMIECAILGSLVNGAFKQQIDRYPSVNVRVKKITDGEFSEMQGDKNSYSSHFSIGNYAGYNTPIWIDGNKFYQRHSCIVGNTGCGKSETVTKIIEETAGNTNCNIVIFDIHGEYGKLSYVDNIKMGEVPFPIWMLGFSDMAANILKVKEESASVVMSALRYCYRSHVNTDVNEGKPIWFDYRTILRFMNDLNTETVSTGEFYKTGDKAGQAKTVKGDFNGKLSGIINIMKSLMNDKRYSFLFDEQPQTYLNNFLNRIMGGDKPVKNIDLSGIPHDIAVLIIGSITKLIYNIQLMQEPGEIKPITLVCDEAHVYIPVDFQLSASQRRMVEIFENIAKEGRKFGITLFVASQRPSELNKTIMAQCANYIVMKLNNENDKTMIKGMMPDGSSGVIETVTMFQPGDALVIGDAAPIPMKVHVDLAKERPQSRTIDFWNEWKEGKRIESVDLQLTEYLQN